jgi:PST family polysaccharide transporter
MISGAWLAGLNLLSLARGLIVAGFLATSEYGVWGVLMAVLATVLWLRQLGFGDRFVQQDDADQTRAFRVFFTLEVGVGVGLSLTMAAVIPLYALLIGEPSVLAPGLAMALSPLLVALQAPIWVFYRDMDYLRQRLLQSIDPVLGLVVTVSLAVAGSGVWSLVIGTLVGSSAQALVALAASPHRPALTRPGKDLREYWNFSWPLLVVSGCGMLIVHGTVLAGEAAVGLAGLGAITLANNVTKYTGQVDKAVTDTLYPAVVRIVERPALLFESFVKSSRLALMWGMPFGLGVTLFADDLVHHVLGSRWDPAVILLQSLGIVTALTQVGFNWTAYFRALGRTRPFATTAIASAATFLAVCVPLLFVFELPGLAAGMLVLAVVQLLIRMHFLRTLFPAFSWWRQAARAVAPVVPATAVVLAIRAAGPDSGALAAAALAAYVATVAVATLWLERALLREALSYLRGARPSLVGA